jgi:hypothetical protein
MGSACRKFPCPVCGARGPNNRPLLGVGSKVRSSCLGATLGCCQILIIVVIISASAIALARGLFSMGCHKQPNKALVLTAPTARQHSARALGGCLCW